MEQREATDHLSTDQRKKDRRLAQDPEYTGKDRRKAERRRSDS